MLNPRRRLVSVSCPRDGTLLFALLAERLGQRVGREPSRLGAWRALERAIRLASLQGYQVVVIVDDCDEQVDATMRRDLDSLGQLGSTTSAGLTIIQLERTEREAQPAACEAWSLTIGLERLTRSQAEAISRDEARMGGKHRADLHAPRDHEDPCFILGRSARNGAARVDLSDRREPSAGWK